jgi:hypothetical protein
MRARSPDSIFTSKAHPCGFDVSAAAKALFRLAARNASHIVAVAVRKAASPPTAAASARHPVALIPIPDQNYGNFELESE